MIGIFSYNRKGWGDGGDGLTWYGAPHRDDFSFRTKVFGSYPNVTFQNTKRLDERKWYAVKVQLWTDKANYFVDGSLFAEVQLKDNEIPSSGYVGFMSYATPWLFRNSKVSPARPKKG